MTNDKHMATMIRLAEMNIRAMLPAGVTLRSVSAEGITIEADEAVSDISLTNILHNLAGWWEYRHGECETNVTTTGGAFGLYKSAAIRFV